MARGVRAPLREEDLIPAGLRRLGSHVALFDEIDSTNEYLLQRCAALPDGAIAATEWQTAGRGQLGRPWLSPPGVSILLSILLIEPENTPLLSGAALLAALGVAEAVIACAEIDPDVRPPNDLLLRGRKIAGVLAETRALSEHKRAVVIGVGLNVNQQPSDFPPELPTATSLLIECARRIPRRLLAGEVVRRLDAVFARS